jgi:SAM-dependent methyltransferase
MMGAMSTHGMETVTCALCGARDEDRLFVGRDRLLGLPGEFTVVQCRGCGLIYTNPRPSPEALGEYYPERYGVYAPEGGQAQRLALYHRRLARRLHASRRGLPGTVLDVGCGEGTFLAEMRALGWKCTGLEMDAGAARRARASRGLQVVNSSVDEAAFPDRFDLVTMSHLLEHVPDPRHALHRAAGWLGRGGRLFLTLPNVDSWERRRFEEDWYPWDLPRHLYHFSPETLERLLAESGFSVERLGFLSGFYAPQSLRYRRQRMGENAPAFNEPPAVDTPPPPAPGAKEAAKTAAFATLLGVASATGRVVRGEIMEILARRP